MSLASFIGVTFGLLLLVLSTTALHEDARCKCVCVDTSADAHNVAEAAEAAEAVANAIKSNNSSVGNTSTTPTLTTQQHQQQMVKPDSSDNSSSPPQPRKSVFVRSVANEDCKCKKILQSFVNDKTPKALMPDTLCPYCECRYQVRNTTTIKVVVCFILVSISCLILYMGALTLLESVVGSSSSRPPRWLTFLTRRWHRGSDSRSPVTIYNQLGAVGSKQTSPSSTGGPTIFDGGRLASESGARMRTRSFNSQNNRSRPTSTSSVVDRVRDQQQRWKASLETQRALVFNDRVLLN